ncbi:hypothetical protein FR5810_03938 [Bordetella pertussis]|nr:hypothetical protein FR5810_03938 [Bordetella pertussis]
MRQRGNQYLTHMAKRAPNVLSMKSELVLDGRKFERPVNYALLRIVPPADAPVDPQKHPFLVVDPRAGHGPGIGGFKPESEIGVAVRAGHPCYFATFLPHPTDTQTVEDVMRAEARFLEEIIALHPQAEGRPVVVGNCQAGWQIMMTAAMRPELFGPIIVAGAPLSYWAGWRDMNPMRYSGGLLGGSWLTQMTSDLGNGKFDGAWLVQNFENLNPANTLWSKQYNLYAKVDTEAPRYLEFEKWWGGHVFLNGPEIQYIVDNLFVGNRLATAGLVTSDGIRIDLRNIRSPIIVFCSKGDNITPPPQALGWITDLYQDDREVVAHNQTIVYAVHESIGHLGIFVSGAVARKEHQEFTANIDVIDVLPPGIYQAEIADKTPDTPNADLAYGDYVLSFERRRLDDVREIVERNEEDDQRFAAVARISDINLGLYRSFVQPWVRAAVTPQSAEWMQRMHPLRLPYELISDRNPGWRPSRSWPSRSANSASRPRRTTRSGRCRRWRPTPSWRAWTSGATCATRPASGSSWPPMARRWCRTGPAWAPRTGRRAGIRAFRPSTATSWPRARPSCARRSTRADCAKPACACCCMSAAPRAASTSAASP